MPLIAMGPVCLILALAVARPNPFSFARARNNRFDPAHPGIVRWSRHLLLVALALWAAAHVLPNGDLAHVMLFSIHASFALLGGHLIDQCRRSEMGAEWKYLHMFVANAPLFLVSLSGDTLLRLAAGVMHSDTLLWAPPFSSTSARCLDRHSLMSSIQFYCGNCTLQATQTDGQNRDVNLRSRLDPVRSAAPWVGVHRPFRARADHKRQFDEPLFAGR